MSLAVVLLGVNLQLPFTKIYNLNTNMAIVIDGSNGLKVSSKIELFGSSSIPAIQINQTGSGSFLVLEDPDNLTTNFVINCKNKNTYINDHLVQFLEDGLYVNKNKLTQNFFNIIESTIPTIGTTQEIPLIKAPYIVYLEDPRSGSPPTQAANTAIQTSTFTLIKPATVQVYVNTIALHTTRVDTYLTLNGTEVVKTLTGTANVSWQPVQLFWTSVLPAGTHTIDYRCTVANVIGSGSTWGRMMIIFYEQL
jgi:hypothetical protein